MTVTWSVSCPDVITVGLNPRIAWDLNRADAAQLRDALTDALAISNHEQDALERELAGGAR